MQLTKFSDYALKVLMYAEASGGRLVTIDEMAGSYSTTELTEFEPFKDSN